ncbi:hypothetical protein [Dyadobacter sp. 3J3]|uniref:hypothetical protein n=1 Tax=Dyadobacter sp. 3J3 TaxID=2606600 RepID=UPI001E62C3E4|nr:hypothetical protein [Dyadobacter sp. 3J3]
MKTTQLFSKTLCAALVAGAMLLSSSLFAQVKIGTNPTTIGATNNLEVEASTAGRKTSIDKTTGKVTIADGSQGLNKVLTSDATGIATWQTQSVGCASFEATGTPQNVIIYDVLGQPNVKIIAGNESYDPMNTYNSTTAEYTVPTTGMYIFKASGGDFILTNDATRNTILLLNSAQKGILTFTSSGNLVYGTATWQNVTSVNYLNAGDVITMVVNVVHNVGPKPAATTPFQNIQFSGSRIDCNGN